MTFCPDLYCANENKKAERQSRPINLVLALKGPDWSRSRWGPTGCTGPFGVPGVGGWPQAVTVQGARRVHLPCQVLWLEPLRPQQSPVGDRQHGLSDCGPCT